MVTSETRSLVERAKSIYAERYQSSLEAKHRDGYAAIEPDSGEAFLGDTFDEAVDAARTRYPDRKPFVIRIGHRAALHLGGLMS